MSIAFQEPVRSDTEISHRAPREVLPAGISLYAPLYNRLAHHLPHADEREMAAEFLHQKLQEVALEDDDLPADPADLMEWMEANVQRVHGQYQAYLERRKAGGPRQYFTNRAHALYFLRNVAPTKLVDGSWLYGLCAHGGNPRLSDLITTYVEELGEGQADKNHVKLYRELLAKHSLDADGDLPDPLFQQGLVQLALGWNAQEFLPEIVGFNLAYEQLPLHLLITAYELNLSCPNTSAGGIEFGRADFGLVDGRPQVYEINTNPTIAMPTAPCRRRPDSPRRGARGGPPGGWPAP